MQLKSRRRYDALICIRGFRAEHPEAAANAAAEAAFNAVDAAITEVELLASGRLRGTNTFLSASAERQAARAELHEFISDLSRISKTLPRGLYPDIAGQLKMGRLNAYQDLLSLARNAIVAITPIKHAFIDRGAPATVTEDIQSRIDALEFAAARRNRGLGSQIATNTSLRIAARNAMDQVRILDGILRFTLKGKPGVLAEWKSAMRLRRRSKSAQPEAPVEPQSPTPSPNAPQPQEPRSRDRQALPWPRLKKSHDAGTSCPRQVHDHDRSGTASRLDHSNTAQTPPASLTWARTAPGGPGKSPSQAAT